MIEQAPPLWLPPRPAIIRPATELKKANFLPGMFPAAVVASAKPASVIGTDNRYIDGNRTSFSFTVNFGEEAERRKIIFSVITNSGLGTNITSVTITGIVPTLALQHPGTTRHRLFIAEIPTGESGNISVQYSSNASGASVLVWAAYDLQQIVPYDAAADVMNSGVAAGDVSVNTRSGGIVVASTEGGANGTSSTWSGVSKDHENTSTINNWQRSGASANVKTGETPRSISITSSNTSSARTALAASFR